MPIFVQTMREGWRGLILWAVALLAIMSLYLSFYQSMGGEGQMQVFIDQLPQGMVDAFGFEDIGSGAGWAQSTFFGLLGLFVLSAAAIVWGTRAIAGDEESGMLELTLAHRVSRSQIYWERALALVLRVVLVCVVVAAGLLLFNEVVSLELDLANVLPQLLAYGGVGLACGAAALAVGGLTGRRGLAIGVGAAVIVLGFLLNAVGNMGEDNGWMHDLSIVSWAFQNRPLANGWDWPGLGLIYGFTAVLLLAGWVGFTRRDVQG